MKIVECPICDAKYDISRVPNGTKLKCANCKKIFGIVQDGELTPFLETEAPAPAPTPAPAEEEEEEDYGFEEVETEYPDQPEEIATEPVEKPGFLLVLGGLIGLVAMGTLAYILYTISQPLPSYTPKTIESSRTPPPIRKPVYEREEIEKLPGGGKTEKLGGNQSEERTEKPEELPVRNEGGEPVEE